MGQHPINRAEVLTTSTPVRNGLRRGIVTGYRSTNGKSEHQVRYLQRSIGGSPEQFEEIKPRSEWTPNELLNIEFDGQPKLKNETCPIQTTPG